jgi:glyceraldehyde 3-phosphate dehydrogenase
VGSISDFTMLVAKKTTPEEINSVFKEAAKQPRWRGILTVTEDPIVSSDIVGNTHSAIVDLALTKVVDGDLVKVVAWYDNEWGYSHRLFEQVVAVGKSLQK